MKPAALDEALRLIDTTPGYSGIGADLRKLVSRHRIKVNPRLEDRAQAGLLGVITLGPEAAEASPLSLAQTLVHEHFHLRRQHPLQKTVSFWSGILTRTPVMRRFEQPAYRAAFDFLSVVKQTDNELASQAEAEQLAICQVFETSFKMQL